MQKHLGKYHGDLMEEVTKSQVAAKVVTKKIDVRCESVRGTVPIFKMMILVFIIYYSCSLKGFVS